jgi:tripartite-type tricarboxylate transporter receptor subunit TctC
MRRLLTYVAFGVLSLAALQPARAQDVAYPTKPVRLVVPYATGGSTDIVARAIAAGLTERLGQAFFVENKPGATGVVGSDFVARSTPDGYTILIGTVSSHSTAVSLYSKLPYDPLKDFAPVTEIATIPNLVVVNPAVVPAKSLAELVTIAKSKPDAVAYASNGPGTSNHLATELLSSKTGLQMIHVPYKGSGPALQDLLAGRVGLMLDVVMTSYPHVRQGKLRALAVTSSKRSPLLPEVPTVAEQGFPGFEAIVWFGIFTPAKTPAPVVQKLNREIATVLQTTKLKDLLEGQGAIIVANSPDDFRAMIRRDIEKWREVVAATGAKLD